MPISGRQFTQLAQAQGWRGAVRAAMRSVLHEGLPPADAAYRAGVARQDVDDLVASLAKMGISPACGGADHRPRQAGHYVT